MTHDTSHITHHTSHITHRRALPGGDTGGVKKTSPMKGKVFFSGDRQTDRQTDIHADGHRDSMTELTQWADSVKILNIIQTLENLCWEFWTI